MTWDILNIIGTIAFALSGVNVAMEEKYDLMGVYVLGFAAAFGGGAVRNLFIGLPVSALWEQGYLFTTAFIIMTAAFLQRRYGPHCGRNGERFLMPSGLQPSRSRERCSQFLWDTQ